MASKFNLGWPARQILHLQQHDSHHDKKVAVADEGNPPLIVIIDSGETCTTAHHCLPYHHRTLGNRSGVNLGRHGLHYGTVNTS